jgi:hypothetical protein
MIEIPSGHKYATVALRVSHVALQFANPLQLDVGRFAAKEAPSGMPRHWKQWLGSIQVDQPSRANLYLLVHAPAAVPESLDDENSRLLGLVHKLYLGLLIGVPHFGHDVGVLMTGVHHQGRIEVRRFQPYEPVPFPCGCSRSEGHDAMLHECNQIAEGICNIYGTDEHNRVWRMLHAFLAGLRSHELGNRLHQFVRCIEGFVLPEIGQTRKQIISRSALFVGSGHEALLGALFDVRSRVEHLHDPLSK